MWQVEAQILCTYKSVHVHVSGQFVHVYVVCDSVCVRNILHTVNLLTVHVHAEQSSVEVFG